MLVLIFAHLFDRIHPRPGQLANERMINRFFHIFARDDGHGMLYEEFLMLLYSIGRDARTFLGPMQIFNS